MRFIDIARGSHSELECYLHFLTQELLSAQKLLVLDTKRIEARRVIFGLWRSLKRKAAAQWDHTGDRLREEAAIYVTSEP